MDGRNGECRMEDVVGGEVIGGWGRRRARRCAAASRCMIDETR